MLGVVCAAVGERLMCARCCVCAACSWYDVMYILHTDVIRVSEPPIEGTS